jgi:hypothetical protein
MYCIVVYVHVQNNMCVCVCVCVCVCAPAAALTLTPCHGERWQKKTKQERDEAAKESSLGGEVREWHCYGSMMRNGASTLLVFVHSQMHTHNVCMYVFDAQRSS